MKLTKPFDQVRSLLQHAASSGGCRGLSIIMAVLLFCSSNSQVIAASMPIGANYAVDVSASATSGDTFNAADLLKESAPAASDDSLTFTQKLEIAGAVLLLIAGGAGYAYRAGCFDRSRGESLEEGGERNRAGSEEARRAEEAGRAITASEGASGSGSELRGTADQVTATENLGQGGTAAETAPASTWETSQAALAAWGQKGWDLVTLKDYRGVAVPPVVVAKPFFEHLDEFHGTNEKKALAAKKAERSWKQTVWDLFALKQHALPDTRTEKQKELPIVAVLKDKPQAQLSFNQNTKILEHATREGRFAAITPFSHLGEMFNALDPEMQEAVKRPLSSYALDRNGKLTIEMMPCNEDRAKQFLYFIVKNHDKLTPGTVEALGKAFPVRITNNDGGDEVTRGDQELWDKLRQEVQALWDKDLQQQASVNDPFERLRHVVNSDATDSGRVSPDATHDGQQPEGGAGGADSLVLPGEEGKTGEGNDV